MCAGVAVETICTAGGACFFNPIVEVQCNRMWPVDVVDKMTQFQCRTTLPLSTICGASLRHVLWCHCNGKTIDIEKYRFAHRREMPSVRGHIPQLDVSMRTSTICIRTRTLLLEDMPFPNPTLIKLWDFCPCGNLPSVCPHSSCSRVFCRYCPRFCPCINLARALKFARTFSREETIQQWQMFGESGWGRHNQSYAILPLHLTRLKSRQWCTTLQCIQARAESWFAQNQFAELERWFLCQQLC